MAVVLQCGGSALVAVWSVFCGIVMLCVAAASFLLLFLVGSNPPPMTGDGRIDHDSYRSCEGGEGTKIASAGETGECGQSSGWFCLRVPSLLLSVTFHFLQLFVFPLSPPNLSIVSP